MQNMVNSPIPVIKATRVTCAGVPDSRAKAKEFIICWVAVFAERIAETKGLDYLDRKKVEHDAAEQLSDIVASDY